MSSIDAFNFPSLSPVRQLNQFLIRSGVLYDQLGLAIDGKHDRKARFSSTDAGNSGDSS